MIPEATSDQQLLDPQVLAAAGHLPVTARLIAEGLQGGSHRSPFKGHSVDFADHRPYVPGDDPRHLDWKVLGRRDRLVIKRFEAERDMGVTFVIDGSASMGYADQHGAAKGLTKYRYASVLAASLAFLVLRQRDRVGWLVADEQARVARQPHSAAALDEICLDLENHAPDHGTDFNAWDFLAEPNYRRGMIFLFSDCLVDHEHITLTLDRLRHRGHDVVVVSILTPGERRLDLPGPSRCQGLENEGEMVIEPRAIRSTYQDVVREHLQSIEAQCRKRRMIYQHVTIDEHPGGVLRRLLVALAE